MIKEIAEDVYRIETPLEGSPLGTLNSYFFKGGDRDWLMDTGFNTESCERSLRKDLKSLDCRFDDLNIINTHMHADHVGLDYAFLGKDRHIFISKEDAEDMVAIYKNRSFLRANRDRREGASEELLEKMNNSRPGGPNNRGITFPEDRIIPLNNRDIIKVGKHQLQIIVVPGHTRGNSMFWMEDERMMFTGDHILFDITPNITTWFNMDDSLGEYLRSLKLAESYDVAQAMPGHRDAGNYHNRIKALLQHHDDRMEEIIGIITDEPGLTAYDITDRMTWSVHRDPDGSMPPAQLRFAAGECMSHLDHLYYTDRIIKDESGDVIRYFPVK